MGQRAEGMENYHPRRFWQFASLASWPVERLNREGAKNAKNCNKFFFNTKTFFAPFAPSRFSFCFDLPPTSHNPKSARRYAQRAFSG
jgi:hypothetical protein